MADDEAGTRLWSLAADAGKATAAMSLAVGPLSVEQLPAVAVVATVLCAGALAGYLVGDPEAFLTGALFAPVLVLTRGLPSRPTATKPFALLFDGTGTVGAAYAGTAILFVAGAGAGAYLPGTSVDAFRPGTGGDGESSERQRPRPPRESDYHPRDREAPLVRRRDPTVENDEPEADARSDRHRDP